MAHFAQRELRIRFDYGLQRLFNRSIDGVEIDYAVFLLVLEVA